MNKENLDNDLQLVCIVVPVYKNFSDLNEYEIISLTQCAHILHNYPIFFAGPNSIDWIGYQQFCINNQVSFKRKIFSNHFFENIQGYNNLMMSIDFYNSFSTFEYMLIYQTDCFVFRDELSEWCKLRYDYIGAPWININLFEWFLHPEYPKKLMYIHRIFKNRFVHKTGNGGFSLRKINSIVTNLKRFRKAAETWKVNEDSFYCHYVGTFYPLFRIPSLKTSLTFSFDANPEIAFHLNNNKLPFACHAWFREEKPYYENNLTFWEHRIKSIITGKKYF